MVNVIAPIIVVGFLVLVIVAYRQTKKTRQELIAEMKEEILVEQPASAVVEAKPTPVETPKAEVKELIAAQEAPVEKPKSKRRRGRPSNKKQNN